MARRSRGDNSIGLFIRFIGMALLFLLLIPGGCQLIGIGLLAMCVLTGVAAIVGIALWQLKKRRKPNEVESESMHSPASNQPSGIIHKDSIPNRSLTERVRDVDWYQFEKIIALAYRKTGFNVSRKGGANPDGGVDLVIADSAGKRTAIQCKQWRISNLGVKTVREFLGALTDSTIQDGIIVTLRGYTGEANQLAEKHRIRLLNESDVVELLRGVDAEHDPEILALPDDTRKFCPKCEREMVLRTNRRGKNPGNKFWGCSAYPRCNFTMPYI